ncbi:MAG: PKD domain-containing protein [Thermoplasmata archaeon]
MSADVGQTVAFTSTASGGLGTLAIKWSGLPVGCPVLGPSVVCAFAAAGTYMVSYNVTDQAGISVASSNLALTLYADPALAAPTVQTASNLAGVADAGMTADLTVNLTAPGAGGPYTYQWQGLPSGCPAGDTASVSCRLLGPGVNVVTVEVSDGNGYQVRSPTAVWITNPSLLAPTIVLGGTAEAGAPTTLLAVAGGGTGPYTFHWCFADGSTLNGTYIAHTFASAGVQRVDVSVEDAAGATRNASLNVTVSSAATTTSATQTSASPLALEVAVIGVLLGILAIVVGFAAWRRGPSKGGSVGVQASGSSSPPPYSDGRKDATAGPPGGK